MAARIVVVDYGMGNIHSILKALRLYSDRVEFSGDPEVLAEADALVLPGDGAFRAAMQGLAGERREALLKSVQQGKPLLGICIGFQILFKDSDEDGLSAGLGILEGRIRRFAFDNPSVRVPHMGWNRLEFSSLPEAGAYEEALSQGEGESSVCDRDRWMYFIHSYRALDVPDSIVLARADYFGDRFAAFVQKDHITAMQFHPEKSDRGGLALIRRWVAGL